jgi:hypothetical protein
MKHIGVGAIHRLSARRYVGFFEVYGFSFTLTNRSLKAIKAQALEKAKLLKGTQ